METQSATPLLSPVRIETPDTRPVLVFRKPAKKSRPRRAIRKRAVVEEYGVEQAVGFLLRYFSRDGEPIDGSVANGLARILELRAKRSGR